MKDSTVPKKAFQTSKKMKPYFLIRYKGRILKWLTIVSIGLGLYGFYSIAENPWSLHPLVSTIGLFVFEWESYKESPILDIATILATITTSFGLFYILFSKHFNNWHIKSIQKKPYNLLIGLSEQTVSLLENSYGDVPTLIIEKNKDHPFIEYFKERGFGVKMRDANKVMNRLDLTHVKRVVISTSNDRKNIALGKQLLTLIEEDKKQSIYVSISNRDLSVLFKQDIISSDIQKRVNICSFSLYENMAKQLFLEHSILGEQPEIIDSDGAFSMVIVGDSDLALEIVYHIAFLSALPYENPLTLYLVDTYASKFKQKIRKTFPNIDSINHLTIKAHNIDKESLEFYKDDVWRSKNLTNIFIATDNEEENLEISINIQDTTYIKDIGHNKLKTKVLFALYHNLGLGEEINKNSDAFANFYTFGNISETSTQEILFYEKLDIIAKRIHCGYQGIKKVNRDEIDHNWLSLSPHKREANKTQALHIDIKLLAFGLKRITSKKSKKELLALNENIFYSKLIYHQEVESELKQYRIKDFPDSFNKRCIDRVARSEHNRWSAFHFLNGWDYNSERNDKAKEHPYLLPLENFPDSLKSSYQYDLASVYYIPQYLAFAGFGIEEIQKKDNKES